MKSALNYRQHNIWENKIRALMYMLTIYDPRNMPDTFLSILIIFMGLLLWLKLQNC